MPEFSEFEVHDVRQSETATFTSAGAVERKTVVMFMVGIDGPFTVQFDPREATASAMRAAIQAKVRELRILRGPGLGETA